MGRMGNARPMTGEQIAAPNSSGTAPPRTAAPVGAVDSHFHIFDPHFAQDHGKPRPNCTVADYLLFRRRLGLSRSVAIAPSEYGSNNDCLLSALAQFQGTARGVGFVTTDMDEAALTRLHNGGIRGLRLWLGRPELSPTPDAIKILAQRAADRGWHLQIVARGKDHVLADWADILIPLPCDVVLDHYGYPPDIGDFNDRTNETVRRLIEAGKTYVKLSRIYISSRVGPPGYTDCKRVSEDLIQRAPERMLWGSDWPHITAPDPKPDGAMLFDAFAGWAGDAATMHRILVENPDRLYWHS
jgi:D-galactarolactone isomerase